MKTRGIANWAMVNHLDKKYRQWKITLELTKAEADKLKAVELPVKKVVTDDDRIVYQYIFTRKEMRADGSGKNKKPQVVDAATNEFTGMIGNGSEVIVKHKPYNWNHTETGKSGRNSDLQGVQIVKLVPYESEGNEDYDDDDDEGFEVIGAPLEGNEDSFKDESKKGEEEELEY